MPITPLIRLSQAVIRNPLTATAAIFAPVFAKNEDRGYFRTALITTPIIFAAGTFVPRLFGGVQDIARSVGETRGLIQKAERWTRFEQPTFSDINTLFKTPGVTQNVIDRALSSYLVTERKSRDYIKEQKVLNKYFNRKFVITSDLISKADKGNLAALARVKEIEELQGGKGQLLSNAMHVARRSSLTPAEWAQETGEFPILNNEQLIQMFNTYEGRPKFRTVLKGRLRELVGKNSLNYSGTLSSTGVLPVSTINSTLVFGDTDPIFDAASMALRQQSPELIENLKIARERGFIRGDIDIEAAKDVVTGKIGKVLNVKVNRPGNTKQLEIPIVDPSTGQVRLFASKQVGVGNYVIGPDSTAL
jgi:hypothetical protein